METPSDITPAQCRAGRALVKWTQAELAEAAGVGKRTIEAFEAGRDSFHPRTIDAIRSAIRSAGVILNARGGVELDPAMRGAA
jgi:DNA-binding XRE family transcriptional regulator